MEDIIKNGDNVLIVFNQTRRWVVQVKEGEAFHTNKGYIKFDDIIGKPYGTQINTSKDHPVLIFTPTPAELLYKTFRQTQIIYPKDASLILIYTGIGPGSQVVEAGSGSGGLTSVLAYYVRPNGKVFSYEKREEFYQKAKKNIARMGLEEYVEFKNRDITEGAEETNIDVFVLDLATPWDAIPQARAALKPGGFIVSFSPQISQVQNTVLALREHNFGDIRNIELLLRTWDITRMKTRPQTHMIGHSGFLTFARKISGEAKIEAD